VWSPGPGPNDTVCGLLLTGWLILMDVVPESLGVNHIIHITSKLAMDSRVVENPHFDESGRPYLEEQAVENDSSSILRDRVVAKEKNKSGRGEQRYELHQQEKRTKNYALSSPTSHFSLAASNCLNVLVSSHHRFPARDHGSPQCFPSESLPLLIQPKILHLDRD
jgi:hypothetical protein